MIEPVWTGLDFSSGPDIAVLTIDDGSDAGSWLQVIEITPHLAAQLHEFTGGVSPCSPNGDGTAGGRPPRISPVVPPSIGPEA